MRLLLLLLLGACGGVSATATTSVNVGATTSLAVDHLGPAPEDVDGHLHESPTYTADFDKLYIEITSDGEHADVLRRSVATGLGAVPYTVCKVKLFVMRLPQHDLLAIADGSGRTTGPTPPDACLSTTGTAIVQQKLPPFLQRQLDAK